MLNACAPDGEPKGEDIDAAAEFCPIWSLLLLILLTPSGTAEAVAWGGETGFPTDILERSIFVWLVKLELQFVQYLRSYVETSTWLSHTANCGCLSTLARRADSQSGASAFNLYIMRIRAHILLLLYLVYLFFHQNLLHIII